MSDDNVSHQNPLKVVICWHMHQPEYRDLTTGQYELPWTYLHATKDYVDMVAHLEDNPGAHAVVNFAPVLLEQLADYADQLSLYLSKSEPFREPLLAALSEEVLDLSIADRKKLIQACLRANEEHLINSYPAFAKLAVLAREVSGDDDSILYMSDQFYFDLLSWYHIAWIGETVKRDDDRISTLVEKAHNFNCHDRFTLITVISEILASIIPRYKALAESGQIELSLSPQAHPILPLMLDFNSAKEAMPDVVLPQAEQYPGGLERVHHHIEKGIQTFEKHFGFKPAGCWPSEGSVSTETLKILEKYDFKWAASGETVLNNSVHACDCTDGNIRHRMVKFPENDIACFFRDDGLSDTIGFTYAKWHADDAVANLIHHLENIAEEHKDHPDRVVSIIMDGENAWEYFPKNACYFLDGLYRELSKHKGIDLTTFSRCIESEIKPLEISKLIAGSWVYGTFSTWIGDTGKNRGWDMLVDAKNAYDIAITKKRLTKKQRLIAEQQLDACEGSDWFWWFGDYNPADTVSDFEKLFRKHLRNLYKCIHVAPPPYLTKSFTKGQGAPAAGGVMRRGSEE